MSKHFTLYIQVKNDLNLPYITGLLGFLESKYSTDISRM
jgi:hypothetical protein